MHRSTFAADLATVGAGAVALLVLLVGMLLTGAPLSAVLLADVAVVAVVAASVHHGVLDTTD